MSLRPGQWESTYTVNGVPLTLRRTAARFAVTLGQEAPRLFHTYEAARAHWETLLTYHRAVFGEAVRAADRRALPVGASFRPVPDPRPTPMAASPDLDELRRVVRAQLRRQARKAREAIPTPDALVAALEADTGGRVNRWEYTDRLVTTEGTWAAGPWVDL